MKRSVRGARRRIEYELLKTERKSLEIRVAPPDSIRVFAPKAVRLSDVDAFVREREAWIDESLKKIRDYQKAHAEAHPVSGGSEIMIEGVPIPIRLQRAAAPRVALEGGVLSVFASDPEDADSVRELIRDYLFDRASERVKQRLDHFAPLIGRRPARVTIRDQKTRWGSCSNGGGVNFNYKLIMAPPEALDYVVIHELCHLFEFNHSPAFWARVEKYQRDYKSSKKWLKDHGAMLGV